MLTQQNTYLSEPNPVAISTAVSTDLTKTGVFLERSLEPTGISQNVVLPAPRALENLDNLLHRLC